jgi:hypothetical protein
MTVIVLSQGNLYTGEGVSTNFVVANPLKNWLLVQRLTFCFISETAKPTVG